MKTDWHNSPQAQGNAIPGHFTHKVRPGTAGAKGAGFPGPDWSMYF